MLHFKDIINRPLLIILIIYITAIVSYDFIWLQDFNPSFNHKNQWYSGHIISIKNKSEFQKQLTVSLNKEKTNVLLTIDIQKNKIEFKNGDEIRFFTKLKNPTSYKNPGGFDYKKYLARKSVFAVGYIHSERSIELIKSKKETFLSKIKSKTRGKIEKSLGKKVSPHIQPVLKAIIWGDQNNLDKKISGNLQKLGVSHLLVISGLNFSLVAVLVYFFIINLLRLTPKVFLYIRAGKIAAGLTWIAMTFYFLICENHPSVLRAYIAISCYFILYLLNQKRDLFQVLIIAALIILICEPFDLFSVSFQLSFMAVLSLIFVYPFLKNRFSKMENENLLSKIKSKLINLCLVNFSIFIFVSPLIAFYFFQINFNGLWMNLWLVPVVEIIIVPFSILASVLSFISQNLSALSFYIISIFIENGLIFLEKLSQLTFEPTYVFKPRFWELSLFYVLLFTVMTVSKFKKNILILGLVLFATDISYWVFKNNYSNSYLITQLDVGQGDSLLVELPGPKRILIDAGGSFYFDVGQKVILPFLNYKRISKLDAIVVTHADMDHYFGFTTLIDSISINEFWWNGIYSDTKSYQKFIQKIKDKNIRQKILRRGDFLSLNSKSFVDVLSPPKDSAKIVKDNNQSLVLKITANKKSALFTGDIEKPVEIDLQSLYGDFLKADYLKVAHHGSKSSSDLDFLKKVKPVVASAGMKLDNRFHHPHPSVLKRYDELKIPFLRTDKLGAITIDLKKDKIIY